MNLVLPKYTQICYLVGFLSLCSFGATAQTSADRAKNVKKEAITAFKAKDYSRAADLFQELYVQTSNGNLLYNVGLCQQRAGQDAKALKTFKKFVAQMPGSRVAGKAKAIIKTLQGSINGALINVLVRSEPSGANIFVNERSGGMIGVTPFTLKLMPGSHAVIVDMKGFEVQTRQVSIAKDSVRELFFQLYPTEQMGALKFMISERDADVMVDKRRIGRSPVREELRLPNGAHDVLVMKPGYTTWRSKVNIAAGQTNTVQIDLLPEKALASSSEGGSDDLYPMLTLGTGVLLTGGAVVLGTQAQSLYNKLESRSAQGVLVHPSDKNTGQSWVMWTNVLSAVGGLAITGGATWWYLSGAQQAETASRDYLDDTPDSSNPVYGAAQ
jgi:hypothetical protein